MVYVCLYFLGSNQVSLQELTEDIMMLDISPESDASNSVNNPKVPNYLYVNYVITIMDQLI
jgi:hypothetical protein